MPEPQSEKRLDQHPDREDLGKALAHYPPRYHTVKRWLLPALGGLAILAAIVLTVVLFLETRTNIAVHGRAIILGIFPHPAGSYAILLIAGLLLVLAAAPHWHDGIQVFERGLLKKTAKREKHWLFENTENFDSTITQVMFSGSVVTTRIQVRFGNHMGNQLIIRNRYENMMELINTIREQVLPGYIDRARQRLQQGETISFHPGLHATADGLTIKGQLTPFDAAIARINNQNLRIHHEDQPEKIIFKSPITRVRNLDLLLTLLENPHQGNGQSSPR